MTSNDWIDAAVLLALLLLLLLMAYAVFGPDPLAFNIPDDREDDERIDEGWG